MPCLAVLSVLSSASSPCPDLKLIHYIKYLSDAFLQTMFPIFKFP
ncbi:hypothetical protein [Neisseria sicca]